MKKHYFRLVDLVVVVAVVGVLTGILLSTSCSARVNADKVCCSSNQRIVMMNLITTMYRGDQRIVTSAKSGDDDIKAWTNYLAAEELIYDLKEFRCPSISDYKTPKGQTSVSGKDDPALDDVYGMVSGSSEWTPENSRVTYRCLDFSKELRDPDYGTNVSPSDIFLGGCNRVKPFASIAAEPNITLGRVHLGEANVFCLDGHVQSVSAGANLLHVPMGESAPAITFKLQ